MTFRKSRAILLLPILERRPTALKEIQIEVTNYQKKPFPFILHANVPSETKGFYTNWHLEIEAILVLEGTEIVSVDDTEYIAGPGDILVINSGKIHTGGNTNWRHHCLIPSMEFLNELGINATALSLQPLIHDEELKAFFEDVVKQYKEDGPFRQALTRTAAERFLLELYKRYSEPSLFPNADKKSGDFAIAVRVINYLRENFAKDFPIENIAREIGITTAYMCRCVKQTTGMTIVDHLNLIRCRAAYHYLANTNQKVHEVAALCGFNGNSYFAKTFQRVMGISPSEVRKKKGEK